MSSGVVVAVPEVEVVAEAHVRYARVVLFEELQDGLDEILVVDDNADAADTLAGLLLLCGADVRVAYDGLAALAVADGFQPDVGLFDVDMPRMGGCELARRVRAAAGRRPMLLAAITGVSDDNAVSRTTTAGFDLHLTKPADPAALLHTLSDFGWWLQAHSSARDSDTDVD